MSTTASRLNRFAISISTSEFAAGFNPVASLQMCVCMSMMGQSGGTKVIGDFLESVEGVFDVGVLVAEVHVADVVEREAVLVAGAEEFLRVEAVERPHRARPEAFEFCADLAILHQRVHARPEALALRPE